MPLFDFLCTKCGKTSELLVTSSDAQPSCPSCGSRELSKLLSAHSSLSGSTRRRMPGTGDTACCGSSPSQAGCVGPGSCCGKADI
ncbi:MAG TPA: FmdB family transcriptional regulator [Nitrospiraceae bacterium]|jgi:putative FmdB family regulatory protein|nr:FmdB family transcriptional regulator [Nitrospiraceae bacterium]